MPPLSDSADALARFIGGLKGRDSWTAIRDASHPLKVQVRRMEARYGIEQAFDALAVRIGQAPAGERDPLRRVLLWLFRSDRVADVAAERLAEWKGEDRLTAVRTIRERQAKRHLPLLPRLLAGERDLSLSHEVFEAIDLLAPAGEQGAFLADALKDVSFLRLGAQAHFYARPFQAAVSSREALAAIVSKHDAKRGGTDLSRYPEIDFSRFTLVLLAGGPRRAPYSIAVESVKREGGALVVTYTDAPARPGGAPLRYLVYDMEAVLVPRTESPVRFQAK